jgi:hypothetical protein
VIGEAADVAPSPPEVPAMPAPAATEVVAVPVGKRPVAADVETADASAPGASEEGGRGDAIRPAGRQPRRCAAELRGPALAAPVPDP